MPSRWAKEEETRIEQDRQAGAVHAGNGAAKPGLSTLPSFEKLDDVELLNEMLAGNQEALAILLRRYEGLIYRVAHRLLRDSGEAQDTVQIVFRDIFLSARQFDERKGSVKAWVLQYAINRAKNRRRDLERQGVYKWDSIDDVAQPSQTAVQEISQLLEDCLSQVTNLERTTIELRYLHGLSWNEVASQMRESVGVVRKRAERAIKKMRAACGIEQ